MNLQQYFIEKKELVERMLDTYLPAESTEPSLIHEAMRYSVLDGGKRIRPILAITAANAVGGREENVLPAACAIEMIHAFSLIHDDLPCMDDDDLRRGKPTSHKVFGEAVALLAGDALLAFAFETISRTPRDVPAETVVRVLSQIAEASGTGGMVGGQILDLLAEGKDIDLEGVRKIHRRKTGALLKVSVMIGGELGGASQEQLSALGTYGEQIGLAFQIVDDILDVEGDEEVIGKKTGADAKLKKATYPSIVGLENSKELAQSAKNAAISAASTFGDQGEILAEIAKFIVERNV